MPNPNQKRNLKAGKGGKREGAGRKTKAEEDAARRFCQSLLKNPKFIASLTAKMEDCTVHPSIMTNVMYYGWGKPADSIEVKQIVPVRIVHQYADDDKTEKKDKP